MSSMRLSHGKALRMRKDDGPQRPLFTRESFLRKGMWASPRMWVPSLRSAVPCWCVCAMHDNLREAAQALSSGTAPMHPALSCSLRLSRGRAMQCNHHHHLCVWTHSTVRVVWAECLEPGRARGWPYPTLHERVRDRKAQRSSCRGTWHQSRHTQT